MITMNWKNQDDTTNIDDKVKLSQLRSNQFKSLEVKSVFKDKFQSNHDEIFFITRQQQKTVQQWRGY